MGGRGGMGHRGDGPWRGVHANNGWTPVLQSLRACSAALSAQSLRGVTGLNHPHSSCTSDSCIDAPTQCGVKPLHSNGPAFFGGQPIINFKLIKDCPAGRIKAGNDNMTTPQQLAHRFAYMFEGKHLGLSIARGWMPLFECLCVQIDTILGQDKLGFHWRQIKEKFGSGRFYWSASPHGDANPYAPVWFDILGPQGVLGLQAQTVQPECAVTQRLDRIGQLISELSQKSGEICIACGKPAAKPTVRHGYCLVLCAEHAALWNQGADLAPLIWFDPSEDLP